MSGQAQLGALAVAIPGPVSFCLGQERSASQGNRSLLLSFLPLSVLQKSSARCPRFCLPALAQSLVLPGCAYCPPPARPRRGGSALHDLSTHIVLPQVLLCVVLIQGLCASRGSNKGLSGEQASLGLPADQVAPSLGQTGAETCGSG